MTTDVKRLWTTALQAAGLIVCMSCQSTEMQAVPGVPAQTVDAGTIIGTVVETVDSGGYTYVLVDTGSDQVWVAGPQVVVSRGVKLSFDSTMAMTDFYSRTLDKTFDRIYFTGAYELDVR
jgi:hypothetical protein